MTSLALELSLFFREIYSEATWRSETILKFLVGLIQNCLFEYIEKGRRKLLTIKRV